MGRHEFFVTKMNASEVAETVRFASDIFQGKTLSDAIQRNLNENRASRDIAFYWRENEARFFNSIVIAAWQGNATFQPIETLESGVSFVDTLITNDGRMRDSFGILAFDGTEQYYALDGQHRVRAIQLMQSNPADNPPPPGFKDDEFTVIIVPTGDTETLDEFRMRYRRMFSALNRYAKPTDNATNIVMDEDDAFAIITRRLITDHPFFRWGDNDWENERVKTDAGKNLSAGQTWFTQIEVLYEMTQRLLSSALRENLMLADRSFKQVRPHDDELDAWYNEVASIWNVLVEVVPHLNDSPSGMRTHNPDPHDDEKLDHLWFWPIGQQMVAKTVRMLIDNSAFDPDGDAFASPTGDELRDALRPLSLIDWDLHAAPWRHLVLVQDEDSWRMRSEGRAQAMKVAEELLMWITGIVDLGPEQVQALRGRWEFNLYQPNDDLDAMWSKVEDLKITARGGHL